MFAVLQAFFLLLSSVTQESSGQQNLQVEIHTTVDLPCSCSPNGPSSVLWYRSRNTNDFIGDGRSIAWRGGELTGHSPGYGINDDFSMVIYNVNLTSQGLYRCVVTPAGGGAKSTCDVTLDVYANPYSFPLIKYSSQAHDINVTCTISHVFPPTFPKLTSYEGNGTTETNEDGTYNTSVSHLFPLTDNDTNIQCFYSNANFKSMSSLLIADCADQPAAEDRVPRNESDCNLNTRCTSSARVGILSVTLILVVLIWIIIVYLILTIRRIGARESLDRIGKINMDNGQSVDGRRDENFGTPLKSAMSLLLGKLYFGVITLFILVTVVIILLAIALGA